MAEAQLSERKQKTKPPIASRIADEPFKTDLRDQIVIYSRALENGGKVDAGILKGSPLDKMGRKKGVAGTGFRAFLDGESPAYEGIHTLAALWLSRNIRSLEMAGIRCDLERDDTGNITGVFSLLNMAYLPKGIEGRKAEGMLGVMRQAEMALKQNDSEGAYSLARPIIRFLEVCSLLESPPLRVDKKQLDRLRELAESAYQDMKSGKADDANLKMDAVFNFFAASAFLDNMPETTPGRVEENLEGWQKAAFTALESGDYQRAKKISALMAARLEREGELRQANAQLEGLAILNESPDVRYIREFQTLDGGRWTFSEKRFEQLTGVAYSDYLKGDEAGEKGIGLLMAQRMRAGIRALSDSILDLERSLDSYATGKDGSEGFRKYIMGYEDATKQFNLVQGMSGTFAARMQGQDMDDSLAKRRFTSAEIAGPIARKALEDEKGKARKIISEFNGAMMNSFFIYASGDEEGGKRIAGRAQDVFKKYEGQVAELNRVFSNARGFERTLGLTSDEAEIAISHALPLIESAACELNLMERSEIAKDIGSRIANIRKLTEINVKNPAEAALANAAGQLYDYFYRLQQSSDRIFAMRSRLLAEYDPRQIRSGQGAELHESLVFGDSDMQSRWTGYSKLYSKDAGLSKALVGQLPQMIYGTYEDLKKMQGDIREGERKIEAEVDAIRTQKYIAVGVGIGVGVIITAATLGVGTGAGIGAGSATSAAIMGGIAVAGGALSGIAVGTSYFQWRVAEIQGAPAEQVRQLRNDFIKQVGISVILVGAGAASGGVRALQAGRAAAWVGRIGLPTMKIMNYTAFGALTLDGGINTAHLIKEERYWWAGVTGALTLLPFAMQGVAAAAKGLRGTPPSDMIPIKVEIKTGKPVLDAPATKAPGLAGLNSPEEVQGFVDSLLDPVKAAEARARLKMIRASDPVTALMIDQQLLGRALSGKAAEAARRRGLEEQAGLVLPLRPKGQKPPSQAQLRAEAPAPAEGVPRRFEGNEGRPPMRMAEAKGIPSELLTRFEKENVAEIIKTTPPDEAKGVLLSIFSETEVRIAMDKYYMESAEYFIRNGALPPNLLAETTGAMRNGEKEGIAYLMRKGFPEEYARNAVAKITEVQNVIAAIKGKGHEAGIAYLMGMGYTRNAAKIIIWKSNDMQTAFVDFLTTEKLRTPNRKGDNTAFLDGIAVSEDASARIGNPRIRKTWEQLLPKITEFAYAWHDKVSGKTPELNATGFRPEPNGTWSIKIGDGRAIIKPYSVKKGENPRTTIIYIGGHTGEYHDYDNVMDSIRAGKFVEDALKSTRQSLMRVVRDSCLHDAEEILKPDSVQ